MGWQLYCRPCFAEFCEVAVQLPPQQSQFTHTGGCYPPATTSIAANSARNRPAPGAASLHGAVADAQVLGQRVITPIFVVFQHQDFGVPLRQPGHRRADLTARSSANCHPSGSAGRVPRLGPRRQRLKPASGTPASPGPASVDSHQAIAATARGILQHLTLSQPAAWWTQPPTALVAALPSLITRGEIGDSLSQVERSLLFGHLTATSIDLQQDQLVTPEHEAAAWQIGGPAAAHFTAPLPGQTDGRLSYDFTAGDGVSLTQCFATTFPVSRLRNLKLFLRADASWNRLYATVEMGGRRYR